MFDDVNKENEKKPEEQKVLFESKLSLIAKESKNKRLLELIDRLNYFKKMLETYKMNNKEMPNQNFRENIFESLEKSLQEIVHINDKNIVERQIDDLYIWFNRKYETYEKLIQLTYRTSPAIDEEMSEAEKKLFDEEYQEQKLKEFLENDAKIQHREHLDNAHKPGRIIGEYKRKIIKDPFKPEKPAFSDYLTDEQKKEKDFLVSTMKSTFYQTNKPDNSVYSGTTNKFFRNNKIIIDANKPLFIHENSKSNEPLTIARSSSSLGKDLQPKAKNYNDNLVWLSIQKELMDEKNRQITERRKNEEVKAMIQEFGNSRAKYKSELQKRHELQRMIKHYQALIPTDEELYAIKDNDEIKEVFDNVEKSMEVTAQMKRRRIKKLKSNINNNVVFKFENKEFHKTDSLEDAISNIRGNTKHKSLISPEILEELNFQDRVNVNNVKNLTKNKIDKSEKEEYVFTIKCKISQDTYLKRFDRIEYDNDDQMPYDRIIEKKRTNRIFNMRSQSQKLLNVSLIPKENKGYSLHFNPLSIEDKKNYDNFNSLYKTSYLSRCSKLPFTKSYGKLSSVQFAKMNYNEDDYLQLRLTMGIHKKWDLQSLTSSLMAKKVKFSYGSPKKEAKYDSYDPNTPRYDENGNLLSPRKSNRKYTKHMSKKDLVGAEEEALSKDALDSAFLVPVKSFDKRFGLPLSGSGLMYQPKTDLDKKGGKKKKA